MLIWHFQATFMLLLGFESECILFQHGWKVVYKTIYDLWIKGFTGLILNIGNRLFDGPCLAIGTIRSESIPHIDDSENSGGEWNFLAPQTAGIPASIPFLMVTIRYIQSGPQMGDRIKHLIGVDRVLAHDRLLWLRQRSMFMENTIWDAHLTDVMQQSSLTQIR